LIAGGHRIDAHEIAGRTEIVAEVYSAADFADEAAIRLREIKENLLRFELTALDWAVHLATWKTIHEATYEPPRRGRKPKSIDPEKLAKSISAFSQSFSKAASEALGVTERSVQMAVQIATGIGLDIRERIAGAPIADNGSELRQLAVQGDERQSKIVGLLLADPPGATSVAEAVAILDRIPVSLKLTGWEKVSDRFSRLPEPAQSRFFEAHADAIDRWLASRKA
jgi:ParB family chromosome partitioning protein